MEQYITKYQSAFHMQTYLPKNARMNSICQKKNTKYQRAFHTQKINHKIPDHIPNAEREKKIPEPVPQAGKYNTKYQSAFHTQKHSNPEELCLFEYVATERRTLWSNKCCQGHWIERKAGKYITQNIRALSTSKKYNTKYHSVLHMQKYIPNNTRMNSTCWKHKILPDSIHTQKQKTQNTRARSTRIKIQHKIPERIPNTDKYNTKYQSAFHTRKTRNPEKLCRFEYVATERRTRRKNKFCRVQLYNRSNLLTWKVASKYWRQRRLCYGNWLGARHASGTT